MHRARADMNLQHIANARAGLTAAQKESSSFIERSTPRAPTKHSTRKPTGATILVVVSLTHPLVVVVVLIVVVEIIPKCVVVDVGEGFVANMKVDGLAVVKVYVDVLLGGTLQQLSQ